MSMISTQVDRLRKAAQVERDLGRHELEQVLLDAADTIWELRDDLQRANAENARLQSQADEWRRVAQSKQDVIDHMRDARAENARLRELVRDMERWCTSGADCTECPFIDECDDAYGEYRACAGWPVIHRRMRELGIEVDG